MKLEVNGTVVAEAADAGTIKTTIQNLPPAQEAIISLWASDSEFMQAAGLPEDGFVMGYHNQASGVELVSSNDALKTATATRVLNFFLAGDARWRQEIGWRALNAKASAVEARAAYRRGLPILLAFAFFALAFVPVSFGIGALLDTLVYEPLCARLKPDVSHYSHGSASGSLPELGGIVTQPTCYYKDNSSATLESIVGGGAFWLDFAGRIGQLLGAVLLIVLILVIAFKLLRRSPAQSPA